MNKQTADAISEALGQDEPNIPMLVKVVREQAARYGTVSPILYGVAMAIVADSFMALPIATHKLRAIWRGIAVEYNVDSKIYLDNI